MTPSTYKTKFGVSALTDESVRKSYGLPMSRNPNWQGGKTIKYCPTCGKKISRHAHVRYCRKCSYKNLPNGFLNKKHTNSTKNKMKISASKRDPLTYKSGNASKEVMSANSKRYWANIPKENRSTVLKKFLEAGLKACRKSSNTLIERMIKKMLDDLLIKYNHGKFVDGFFVDFLIPDRKIIIEAFGDYWHCNPLMYKSDYYHKNLHMTAKQKWDKDNGRQSKLTQSGYKVYVFWENEIKNNQGEVLNQIKNIFDKNFIP